MEELKNENQISAVRLLADTNINSRGKFEKLQKAILDYFNDFNIHPYTAGLEDVWPWAEIQVNKKKTVMIRVFGRKSNGNVRHKHVR